MSEVKWIKIVTDIFDDEKIKLIEKMPEADSLIVIWFKILCLAGRTNKSGLLMLNDKIYYTDEMLSGLFNRPLATVRMALEVFEKFGMIELINNAYYITNWEKHQNVETLDKVREQTRLRVNKYRQKLLDGNVTCNATVTECNAREEEREEDIDKNKKYIYSTHVLLTHDEYEKLCTEYGQTATNEYIERLNDYIEQIGEKKAKAKYKSHYAVIRNWYRRDKQNGSNGANQQNNKFASYDKSKWLGDTTVDSDLPD